MKCLSCLVAIVALFSVIYAASLREPSSTNREAISLSKASAPQDIWKDCTPSTAPVKIQSVTLTPDPPERGKDLSAVATFTLSENVTGGDVSIELKWGIIKVINQDEKICDVLKDAGLSCPLTAGTHTVNDSLTIPSAAPGGHYTGSVHAKDQNGKELLCLDLDFHM